MSKKVLIVYGGWAGHTPEPCAKMCQEFLTEEGYEVTMRDTLDAYTDEELMNQQDLIVQIWTMGKITGEQFKGLSKAVRSGIGFAGFHGGIIDAFRENTSFQWMTGGQFVDHPGGCIPTQTIHIVDKDHPITKGIADFAIPDTEQYYCHVDPGVHVLCSTTFSGEHGDPSLYEAGTVMPYAWTKKWDKGKVFVAAWGHTDKDFAVPEALEIVKRGFKWATR